MKRLTGAVGALLLLLVACLATGPNALAPGKATPATPPEKDSGSSLVTTTLGLVTQDEAGYGLRGRPVDPHTLADLPGYEAIDFGHHYTSAISPDGRTLALIAWRDSAPKFGGDLRLVRLPAWEVRDTEVVFNRRASLLHFSSDGSALYWVEAAQRDAAHGIPSAYRLYRYEVATARMTMITKLPSSIQPWEMRLLAGGSTLGERMAIYGLPVGADYLAEGAPRLLLVDLAAETIAADVPLQGVTAGQSRVDTAEEGQNPYRMVRPALAWDMARSLLYVVHGDEDKVTLVDLAEAEVRRPVDIRPRQSILERILGWGAGVAQAKIVPGTDRQAALSHDGSRLYVTGLRREMVPVEEGDGPAWQETPLGLEVIATDDLARVQRLDLPVNGLALSPDGRWLLLKGGYDRAGPDGEIERVREGLYVVDTKSMQVTAQLLPGQEVYLQGFSADGRQAYVSTGSSEWLGDHYGNWTVTLHLLDLQTGRFVAQRQFPGYVLDVIKWRERTRG